MKASTYHLIIKRFLFKKQSSSLRNAALIIALSLIPLVLAFEVSEGMERGILGRSLETATYHLRADALTFVSYDDAEKALTELLAANKELIYGTIEMQSVAVAFNGIGRSGVLVRGLDPSFYTNDRGLRHYLSFVEGVADLSADDNILIGKQMALKHQVKVGEKMRLLSVNQDDGDYRPQVHTFTITGIFSTGYQELDKSWVILGNKAVYNLFSEVGVNAMLGLKVASPFSKIEKIRDESNRLIDNNWIVYDWRTLNASQITGVQTTKTLLFFILGLIVIVAVINTSGSIYMFYLQNRKDVAALLALGITLADLKTIFLLSTAAVGFLGALIGLICGSCLALSINHLIAFIEKVSQLVNGNVDFSFYLETIPIHLNYLAFAGIAITVTFLAMLSALIPIRKASKMFFVELIRK